MTLYEEFMGAINRATQKWNTYKRNEAVYKGKVDAAQVDLEKLIGQLRACIDRLIDLQGDYSVYIRRITTIREDMQQLLNQQIEVIQRSDDACDVKINQLKTQFEQFVNQIQDWEDGELRFEQLFRDLNVEIKRICDRADRLDREKTEREAKKQEFENEIKLTEDLLDSKRRERTQDSSTTATETKRPEVQEPQQQQPEQVEVDGLPDGWTAYRDPDSQRTYYTHIDGRTQWDLPEVTPRQQEEPRQQGEDFGEEFDCTNHPKARFGQDLRNHILRKWNGDPLFRLDRQAKKEKMQRYLEKLAVKPRCKQVLNRLGLMPAQMANLLDKGDNGGSSQGFGRPNAWRAASDVLTGGRRTRKKRGGWQTPQKLESISRYSPIRRVERKKKKKKKKNTKKNKKRRRRKQTKRRGKKRN
jgi:hypothetical protein